MATRSNAFTINGVVDTNRPVLENMEAIASAAGAFVTYDTNIGKWAVVINDTGTSSFSIRDSRIVGNIAVSKNSFRDMYNAVQINFPHKDLANQTDFIRLTIPEANRYDKEPENVLTIDTTLINDPVQAEQIAFTEMMQSRVDTTIQFTTDFHGVGIQAGDIIGLYNDEFDWDNQLFRVVQVEEEDDDDGNLFLTFNCIEYDGTIYNTTPSYIQRDRNTGIKPKTINTTLDTLDDVDTGTDLARLLGLTALSSLFNNTLNTSTGVNELGPNEKFVPEFARRKVTISGPTTACEGQTITLTVTAPTDSCTADDVSVNYQITGVQAEDIDIDLIGSLTLVGGTADLVISITGDSLTEGTENMAVNIGGCTTHTVAITDHYLATPVYTLTADKTTLTECEEVTFTLSATNTDNGTNIPYTITGIDAADIVGGSLTGNFNADWCDEDGTVTLQFNRDTDSGNETLTLSLDNGGASLAVTLEDDYDYSISWSPSSITEGSSSTATITVTGGIPDGTIPYTLTGSGASKISSPATSGTITITSGSGSITVNTDDDTFDDGTSTLITLTVGPYTGKHCTGVANLTVNDNDSPDNCTTYTSVPVVWRGCYNGDDDELQSMEVLKYAKFQTYPTFGTGINIPTSVTVTKGNPSTITVNTTTTVYPGVGASASDYIASTGSNGLGGQLYHIITTFDSISAGTAITGTTETAVGFDE